MLMDITPASRKRTSLKVALSVAVFALATLALAGAAAAESAPCPNSGPLFVVRDHDSRAAPRDRALVFARYVARGLRTENALVLLGPNVDLDFSVLQLGEFNHLQRLIEIAPCVRMLGVADLSVIPAGAVAQPIAPEDRPPATTSTYRVNPAVLSGATRQLSGNAAGVNAGVSRDPDLSPPIATWDATWVNRLVEARAPGRRGPIVRYGPSRSGDITTFLSARCWERDRSLSRMAGFRIAGPATGQQNTVERGIGIERCPGIEITNMEIYGWGGSAIGVSDKIPEAPTLLSTTDRAHPILIHGNYIHHNQHPDGLGYGISSGGSAWVHIYENVFDFNRHAIAAGWDVGGYRAERNLVLKGGGYHSAHHNTHQFDVHGSGCIWSDDLCGTAGDQFWIQHNTFQYTKGSSIEIRGLPRTGAEISGNIFAVQRLLNVYHTIGPYDAMINPAIALNRDDNVTVTNNATEVDSYGQYGVCDFDADGVDDLFQATGVTWWYSASGKFPWTYLNLRTERVNQLQMGEFDATQGCDVLVEQDGGWVLFSGGRGNPQTLGEFGVRLREVGFGRFGVPSEGLQASMQAFRRDAQGNWLATALDKPRGWRRLQRSDAPFDQLRFHDVTGNGLTDVIAVVGGRWSYSEGGTQPWTQLNASLSAPMGELFFADVNADGRTDFLRLERKFPFVGPGMQGTLTWLVSDGGRAPWRALGPSYQWTYRDVPGIIPAFAGNFSAGAGGGVLLIDENRIGHFRAPNEVNRGASPDWSSTFAY